MVSSTLFPSTWDIKKIICEFQKFIGVLSSVQFSSVTQSCPTLCNPMNCSTPGLPVHHQFPEFTQTHVHQVGDAIQPSHLLSSLSPPAPNPFQHQSPFQWVNASHESIGVSALALVLPKNTQDWSPLEWTDLLKNTQDWSPLEWTGWISLQSKRLSIIGYQILSNKPTQKLVM